MLTLFILGLCLALVALVLAWPIPEAMARATLARSPTVLMALWQALGLAGGLSLVGAITLLALVPSLHALRLAAGDPQRSGAGPLAWWQWALLVAALVMLARLLWCLVAQYVRAQRARRRHVALVELLTSPSQADPGTRLLPSEVPLAYCVPGAAARGTGAPGTTVLSTGLIAALSEPERRAVIAHESAHLRYHHQLFVIPFAAWHRALPFLPATARALSAVSALIEFMADDAAVREAGPEALASAIATSAGIHPGESNEALTRVRLSRLG